MIYEWKTKIIENTIEFRAHDTTRNPRNVWRVGRQSHTSYLVLHQIAYFHALVPCHWRPPLPLAMDYFCESVLLLWSGPHGPRIETSQEGGMSISSHNPSGKMSVFFEWFEWRCRNTVSLRRMSYTLARALPLPTRNARCALQFSMCLCSFEPCYQHM